MWPISGNRDFGKNYIIVHGEKCVVREVFCRSEIFRIPKNFGGRLFMSQIGLTFIAHAGASLH